MARSLVFALCFFCSAALLHAEKITLDVRTNAILLTAANAKMVGDLTPNQPYAVTVTGTSNAPMQGVYFMLQNPTQHEFRYVSFGESFTFVPVSGAFQLAAFYVDWSTTADNSGAITVTINGPTSKTLNIDPKLNAILLDTCATIVGALNSSLPHVVSVRESAISGTPLRGAIFMYQEVGGNFGFRCVPAGEGFIFKPIGAPYQLAAFYVDWSTTADNSGKVFIDIKPRESVQRTIRLDEKNDALLLTSSNSKIVGDLTPNQMYTVSVTSTVPTNTTPMTGAFFMLQTPTEHNFRYVKPGESFTFVPVDGAYQLAAFYVDWSDLSDNTGTVTITIKDANNVTKKTLTLDARLDAILLDNVTPVQTDLITNPPNNEWVVSVKDSSIAGTPVTGAYFMYLDAVDKFLFKYIPNGGAVIFKPVYPAIYQIAPLIVDWSTKADNSGKLVVEFSGPFVVPVKQDLQPVTFALQQNFPNPFNPSTTIRYSLSSHGNVVLAVFDVLGQKVADLVNEEKGPGNNEIVFDGSRLSSGIYWYRLQAGGRIETKALVLQK